MGTRMLVCALRNKALPWCLGLCLWLLLPGCGDGFERKDEFTGYRGLARGNPLFAAGMLAEELGYPLRRGHRVANLPPTDWALLVHQSSLGSIEDVEALLDWASNGGRLWISGVFDAEWNPKNEEGGSQLKPSVALSRCLEYLVNYLGASNRRSREMDPEFLQDNESGEAWPVLVTWPASHPDKPRSLGGRNSGISGSLGRYRNASLLRYPLDEGSVELFAGLRGFDNWHLNDPGRAQLFDHLLQSPDQVAGVMILQGDRPGFFSMLWDRAAPVILIGLLWILCWLVRGLRRFGPKDLDPHWDPEGEGIGRNREFEEHLVAAAKLHRQERQEALLLPAVKAVNGQQETQTKAMSAWQRIQAFQRMGRTAFVQTSQATHPSPNTTQDAQRPDTTETQ